MTSRAHHVKVSPYKMLPELFLPEISDKSSDHEKNLLETELKLCGEVLAQIDGLGLPAIRMISHCLLHPGSFTEIFTES